jgi:hypothetical protein
VPSNEPIPPAERAAAPLPAAQVIRISPLALFAVVLLLVCILFPALGWPHLLGWLLAVPLALAYWILRVRTTVSETGLRTRSLRGSEFIEWREIKGLRFPKRGWCRADLLSGREVPLPAVTMEDTPLLARYSSGRVPDPYAAARKHREDSA